MSDYRHLGPLGFILMLVDIGSWLGGARRKQTADQEVEDTLAALKMPTPKLVMPEEKPKPGASP